MINYSSIGFYYFSFIASFLAAFWSKSVERKYLLAGLNIFFHVLFFYFFKIHFLFLIFSVVANWIIVLISEMNPDFRKNICTFAIIGNLLSFILIKYSFARFSIGSFNTSMLSFVGISFFAFRMISFFIDYKREQIAKPDFIHFTNYLTFFPTFLSGPLDRYENFKGQVELNHSPDSEETVNAVFRFVSGVFKKVVIVGLLHDLAIDAISKESLMHFSAWQILLALYSYTFVLYLDFSGYTDMAIGLSQLLGIKIPENFNKPFLAKNIQDFWNRWHISFMQWLRDYVYYPFHYFLLKRLKMKSYLMSAILSTFLIFFLTGAWHGDKVQYFIYGSYHGIAFSIFLIWRNFIGNGKRKKMREKYFESAAFKIFSRFLTFHYFVFSLLFFTGNYEVLLRWI